MAFVENNRRALAPFLSLEITEQLLRALEGLGVVGSRGGLGRDYFFFNDTATTEIYTLSLHDALPISARNGRWRRTPRNSDCARRRETDRKSTRLNSSHRCISYAVFCLKKKNKPT